MKNILGNTLFNLEKTEPPVKGQVIRVAFDSGVDTEFDYLLPDALGPIEPGRRVQVPFGRGNKPTQGFCVAVINDADQTKKARSFKLKLVKKIIDAQPLLDTPLMELARWISSYYVCPLGQVLVAMVPAAVKKQAGVTKMKVVYLVNQKDIEQNISSEKQEQIVAILRQKKAFDEKSAIPRNDLMAQALIATPGPFNNLARKNIIRITTRQFLKPLPAIPDGLSRPYKQVTLNAEQLSALEHIIQKTTAGDFAVTLLHGVTDIQTKIRTISRTALTTDRTAAKLPVAENKSRPCRRRNRGTLGNLRSHCQPRPHCHRRGTRSRLQAGHGPAI